MKNHPFPPASKRGQILVEFAVSLTVFLLLLAGTVDFGIGLFHYIAMHDAAQEGALYGSINPPPLTGSWTCPDFNIDRICERVITASGENGLLGKMYASGMSVAVAVPDEACEGHELSVTLQYDYPLTMPFIGAVIGSDHIRLTAAAVDTILTPSCP